MRIGFVINDLKTERASYTTVRLGMAATNRGHEAWFIGVGNFAYDPDEKVRARAHSVVAKKKYKSSTTYLGELQSDKSRQERVTVDDLDVVMLRNDPAVDKERPWAQSSGIIFGRAAMPRGVIVLNDPNGLTQALNKMYFQLFPEEVRPATLISRDRADIKAFAKEQGGASIVLKPLTGSGGESVFLVRKNDLGNLNQMVEAVSRDGYVIAQQYIPEAEAGDTRLFLMNGMPLRYKGKYAAFRRIRNGDDIRSNIHAGGTSARAEVTDKMLELAEMVRPKLVADGMFLVGLDIVGDKLMEINVFSPGGLGSAHKFEGVNFPHAVIEALEKKVEYMRYYRRKFNNRELATL